jgi:hypothetical protein
MLIVRVYPKRSRSLWARREVLISLAVHQVHRALLEALQDQREFSRVSFL